MAVIVTNDPLTVVQALDSAKFYLSDGGSRSPLTTDWQLDNSNKLAIWVFYDETIVKTIQLRQKVPTNAEDFLATLLDALKAILKAIRRNSGYIEYHGTAIARYDIKPVEA